MQKITKRNLFQSFYFLFFMLCSSLMQGQLTDFSFTVQKTNETCESNGTLSFSVQNTTAGAVITYSIYLLPNVTSPITVTTQNNYTGLNSGTYLIIATQNLSGQTNSQQQTVIILDQVVPLQYQLQGQEAVCINNGKITVLVTQGQAVNYEIISGPILKPLQTSNIFTELSAGVYLIRVYDSCGNAVVQTYTLFELPTTIDISPVNNITIVDCTHAIINQTITAGDGVIFYPLTILYTITLPNGQTEVVTQTLSSGNDTFITIAQNIPITIGETVSYTLSIQDGCGTTFTGSGTLSVPTTAPNIFTTNNGCDGNTYKVQNASNVVVIEAPTTLPFPLPYTVPTSGNNEYPLTDFPLGYYKLEVTNLCGVVSYLTVTIVASNVAPPTIAVRLGCENGFGSLKIGGSVNLVSAQLLQAPAAAGFTLPMDVSTLLSGTPVAVTMNNLPVGEYSFSVVDGCGISYNLSATIQNYQEVKTVNVIEHCGSFDLFLNHVTTPSVQMTYHLQKFYTNGNYWGHPISGSAATVLDLVNNTTKYNIASSGHFRIIGKNFIYGNGGSSVNCVIVINEFDFYSLPKINAVYSFACDAGGFDVYVDAIGISELKYKVIAKNGLPFLIDNLIDPLFTNLLAGTYTFQVEDGCSNILIGEYEVGNTQNFPISVSNLCPQQNAFLSVANLHFLNYQWWKGTNTSTVLSTSNSLILPNFNPTTDAGLYHVRIYYANSANTCIDVQMDYLIDVNNYIVSAGQNTTKQYCGNPGSIDLFQILLGNPNANGIWTDLSNTGFLNGSIWNASSMAQGTYTFKYTVTGLCNIKDFKTVTVVLNTVPENIEISGTPVVCSGDTIELTTDLVPNATYFWQGPNDFNSEVQNPLIENATTTAAGTYTLMIKIGECASEPVSYDITVNEIPEFTAIGNCVRDNSDYELFAQPTDPTLNPEDFTYSWNGPAGNLGSSNPISILGKEAGTYTVIITNGEGCSSVVSVEVSGTVCRIPKGISPNNDGDNDSFDLSGFKVKRLIVYSRYGRIVYEKRNYTNEWHGQDYKDRNLPSATYYYYIETESGEELVGWVYVLQ